MVLLLSLIIIIFALLVYVKRKNNQQKRMPQLELYKTHQYIATNIEDNTILVDIFSNGDYLKYFQLYKSGEISQEYITYMKYIAQRYIEQLPLLSSKYKARKQHSRFFNALQQQINEIKKIKIAENQQINLDSYWRTVIEQEDETMHYCIQPQVEVQLQALPIQQQRPKTQVQQATTAIQQTKPVILQSEKIANIAKSVVQEKRLNDKQNVHQSVVLKSANSILQNTNTDAPYLENNDIIKYIREIKYDNEQKKKQALDTARHMLSSGINITAYGKNEADILQQAVSVVQNSKNIDNEVYLIEQLADCAGSQGNIKVCPTGRTTRIVDVIGLASDQKIIPEYVIKESILNKMNQLYTSIDDKGEIKKQLKEYIDNDFGKKELISDAKRDSFIDMVDSL